ncbi:MAG: M48 family metalloprotease [Nitrospirae bacterium]|nr:M48 family metalloprotease [Nitrospirota bacterium]
MPITFIDIEREKSSKIAFLFIFLIVLYFFVTLSLFLGISVFFFPLLLRQGHIFGLSLLSVSTLFFFSLSIAACHFWFSSTNVIATIMRNLAALPPDPRDGRHRRLLNIMDEIRIASGNRKKMRCLVIPSLSLNALAADDLRGEAVIAITEGLLSRLSRDQTEAVIAHEAYHILSGDCKAATLATSLFGMYVSILENMESLSDDNRRGGLEPSFFPLWLLLKLSDLLCLFISREREYRADAAAVRMTRNPLAMAEALHFLSRNWTGGGMISTGLEMLCIVNPVDTALDETESWWADRMSTHPPIMKRIDLLLKMAHTNLTQFEKRQDEKVIPGNNVGQIGPASSFICPECRQVLYETVYEDTVVFQCNACRGILVENASIVRIIARRERPCTERVRVLARAVLADNQRDAAIRRLKKSGKRSMTGHRCLKCGNVMFRTFYSGAYLIEIDRCNVCGLTWFDVDELEMLQCLIENRIAVPVESSSGLQGS